MTEKELEYNTKRMISELFDISLDYYDNPSGVGEFGCPLCGKNTEILNPGPLDLKLKDIEHYADCIYLQAREIHKHYLPEFYL